MSERNLNRVTTMAERSILTVVYGVGEKGGFYAYVEEISGVRATGETMEEARENLATLLNRPLLDEDWLDDKLSALHPTDRAKIERQLRLLEVNLKGSRNRSVTE
jgi:hypothetical protein